MAWQQTTAFNLAKMGKKPGMCLQNVRLAYDIPAYYYDAKAAMLANKNAGTLHPISTLPKNCAVPVFVDTASPNEHVEVADHGTFYSDGKVVPSPTSQVFFGWGETLNEVRIVKWVADPTPTPTPTGIKVGDKVTLTKWVAYDGTPLKKTRDYYFVSQISGDRAVLNADSVNGVVYAAVNTKNLVKYNAGDSIKVGDKVTLKNWVAFDGTPLMKTRDFYYVSQINGDKAVLRADDAVNGPVYAAVWLTNLIKV
jgi:hypothetical protein